MEILLQKLKSIYKLILKPDETPVDFVEIARKLGENIKANIYIIGRRGKILGFSFQEDYLCPFFEDVISYSESFPESYNRELLLVTETKDNIFYKCDSCLFCSTKICPYSERRISIIPIYGGGDRLGSLVLFKTDTDFAVQDLILAEYGALVTCIEILRLKAERLKSEGISKTVIQIALGALSSSELDAIEHILSELGGSEGTLVASKIANEKGIRRSVIVNALKKLESTGVIEAKSLGMKGTYIRVFCESLLDEIKKLKKKSSILTY